MLPAFLPACFAASRWHLPNLPWAVDSTSIPLIPSLRNGCARIVRTVMTLSNERHEKPNQQSGGKNDQAGSDNRYSHCFTFQGTIWRQSLAGQRKP